MTKAEICYCIADYCAQYEIDITEAEIEVAADALIDTVVEHEEYNYRCGIHGIDIDIILDHYFEEWEAEH